MEHVFYTKYPHLIHICYYERPLMLLITFWNRKKTFAKCLKEDSFSNQLEHVFYTESSYLVHICYYQRPLMLLITFWNRKKYEMFERGQYFDSAETSFSPSFVCT